MSDGMLMAAMWIALGWILGIAADVAYSAWLNHLDARRNGGEQR